MPALRRVGSALKSILLPVHLRRTGVVAFIVGTWLTLFNHGGAIWSGETGPGLWVKLALNYLTPFVVANLGLLSGTREDPARNGVDATNE